MAGFTAVNDTNQTFGGLKFKTCLVSFIKNKPAGWPEDKPFKLSQLQNIRFGKHKDKVICFCENFTEIIKTCKEINKTCSCEESIQEFEDAQPVELEKEFSSVTISEAEEIKNDREFLYQKDKRKWVNTFSKNARLVEAIKEGYDCDEQYCIERLKQELPCFYLVDSTTIFWRNGYPTEEALKLEKHIKTQVNGHTSKYGTYTRACLLEEHNHINCHDEEAIVIFNYLHKFDVISTIREIEAYEQQLKRQSITLLSD